MWLCFPLAFHAQAGGAEDQRAYIEQWKDEAIRQMVEHRIPASITLAQGLLESGSGKSELSRRSNNHFGIKCHKEWDGGRTYHDDDKKGECFRVYDDPKDSYRDHSLFLKRDRYAPLFALKIDDYKGWARGLKRCGYATSPTYAKALIELIERHSLDRYDEEGLVWMEQGGMPERPTEEGLTEAGRSRLSSSPPHPADDRAAIRLGNGRQTGMTPNDVMWVEARQGETLGTLARDVQVAVWQLRKYNNLDGANPNTVIEESRRLYIQPKRRRAKALWHVVQRGETLREISDAEAVKLKVLVSRTGKTPDEALPEGLRIPLRFPPQEDGSMPWYARWGAADQGGG